MRAWVKTAKLIQHVKLVHIFNVLFCRGGEQLKLFVSALSFSSQRIDLSLCLFIWTLSFSCQRFPYMSALLVISVPSFLRQPSSFCFNPVLSFQPCPFVSTLSLCLQIFPISFQPYPIVSTLSYSFRLLRPFPWFHGKDRVLKRSDKWERWRTRVYSQV